MNGFFTALMILLVLVALGQIRIGAQVEYCEDGFFVRVRAGGFLIPVFPARKKNVTKKASKSAPKKQKQKNGGTLSLVFDLLPAVLETARKFRRKLRVDRLEMSLTVCADDPADAAVRYGQANALLGAIWEPAIQTFRVKDGSAHVEVDFEGTESTLYILASPSLTISQTLWLVLGFAFRALGILIRTRTGRTARPNQEKVV